MADVKFAHSRREVLELEDQTSKFLIDPYIPEAGIVLIYGKFGTYKTPLTMTLARSIADGTPTLGLEVARAGPVLYIEADSPKTAILGRFKAILREGLPEGGEVDVSFCYPGFNAVQPTDPRDKAWIMGLSALHRERQYRAVFVDALRCLHTFDDKDSLAPIRTYRALARMFPDAVIVLVHHDRKSYDNQRNTDETFSGSQAWANHATVAIQVKHANKTAKELMLTHVKSQAGELAPTQLLRVRFGTDFTGATKVDKDVVLDTIKTVRPRASSLGEIDRLVAEALGISVDAARMHRQRYAKDIGYEDAVPGQD
jgi:RecA-family ATPase